MKGGSMVVCGHAENYAVLGPVCTILKIFIYF